MQRQEISELSIIHSEVQKKFNDLNVKINNNKLRTVINESELSIENLSDNVENIKYFGRIFENKIGNITELLENGLINRLPVNLFSLFLSIIFSGVAFFCFINDVFSFTFGIIIPNIIFFLTLFLFATKLENINKIVKLYLSIEQLETIISGLIKYESSLKELNNNYNDRIKQSQERHTSQISINKYNNENAIEKIKQKYKSDMNSINLKILYITKTLDKYSPIWSDKKWHNWNSSDDISLVSRFGEFNLTADQHTLSLPAFFYFPGDKNILFKTHNTHRDTIVNNVKSLLLRLLSIIPPGKFRFIFIDPVALGQNVAPFLHLSDYDEDLISKKVWTEKQHIEKKLVDLTEHMVANIIKYFL